MPRFGLSSKKQLMTCHPKLQRIMNEVIKSFDISVIEGYRSNEEQEKAFRAGRSKLRAGQSKHNMQPSRAVDVVPYPVNWKQLSRFYFMGGYVQAVADELGIKIRWGGDWNSNGIFSDQKFHDLPHFELADDEE